MSVSQTNPAFAKAWGVIKVLSADEEARLLAESREKARMDFEDRYDGAFREGKQEGKQEGLQEGLQKGRLDGRREIALKALRKNIPLEDISDLTGLSLTEIEQLAAELAR